MPRPLTDNKEMSGLFAPTWWLQHFFNRGIHNYHPIYDASLQDFTSYSAGHEGSYSEGSMLPHKKSTSDSK